MVMKEERVRPEGMDDETWEMAQLMGFAGFKSTKNTKVPGNDKNYGVRRDKQMEARQYMNRQGGFNRPLSPAGDRILTGSATNRQGQLTPQPRGRPHPILINSDAGVNIQGQRPGQLILRGQWLRQTSEHTHVAATRVLW